MARASTIPASAESGAIGSFPFARAVLGFGLGMCGGVFLAQFGVGLIDGWANVGPERRLILGLSIWAAMICAAVAALLLIRTGGAWKRGGAVKWVAIFGASFFSSFLSGALIRGSWALWSLGAMAGSGAIFAAAVVLAVREDLGRIHIENAN